MTAAARMALEATGLVTLAVLAWIVAWATNDGWMALLGNLPMALGVVLGWRAAGEYLRGVR